MSDYSPDPRRPDPRRPDPYGTTPRYEYTEVTESRSTTTLLAVVGIMALVGGVLMLSGPKPADQQSQTPPTSPTTPLERPAPAPATPANPQQ